MQLVAAQPDPGHPLPGGGGVASEKQACIESSIARLAQPALAVWSRRRLLALLAAAVVAAALLLAGLGLVLAQPASGGILRGGLGPLGLRIDGAAALWRARPTPALRR